MSVETVFQAVNTLLIPSAIPVDNRQVWWPESFSAYPSSVLSLSRASTEKRVAIGKKQQYHWVEVDFIQRPELVGGTQAAVTLIRTWIEHVRTQVHTNRRLTLNGVDTCSLCGESPANDGIESYAGLDPLSDRSGDLLARGYLVIPVQDLWEDG